MSKLDQLRALREAKFVTRVTNPVPVTKPTRGKKALAQARAFADWAVSHPKQADAELKKAAGRPRVYGSNADRQRAYRARRKAVTS